MVSELEHGEEEGSQETGEPEESRGPGIGEILKAEREKRGLSIEQIEETTRLRKHFIEALENEDWDNLPPAVFVRGFIRSYARSVGLDEKEVLGLYERIAPGEPEVPLPLVPSSRPGKKLPVILIILVMAVAVIAYFWKDLPFPTRTSEEIQENIGPKATGVGEGEEPESTAPVSIQEGMEPEPEKESQASAILPDSDTQEAEASGEPDTITEGQKPRNEGENFSIAETAGTPPTSTGKHVLTGIVKERTWIKIFIDGREPKEYIFQPGSRPQWKADESFEVIVGNAAGIEFEYDGKKIEGLGNLGQVVRLRLPEDAPETSSEE